MRRQGVAVFADRHRHPTAAGERTAEPRPHRSLAVLGVGPGKHERRGQRSERRRHRRGPAHPAEQREQTRLVDLVTVERGRQGQGKQSGVDERLPAIGLEPAAGRLLLGRCRPTGMTPTERRLPVGLPSREHVLGDIANRDRRAVQGKVHPVPPSP